jgi:hypothetical protein
MHSYTAFGLKIDADVPLPELFGRNGCAPADLVVRRGDLGPTPPAEALNEQRRLMRIDGDEAFVFWDFIGTVRVRSGAEIVFDPLPKVHESAVRSVIVGVALGIALRQRGFFTLHASAVAVDGGAVAFVGKKGMGKSTTAAALCGRGHRLVSDDVLALPPAAPEAGGALRVFPGFPQLKLWPGSAEAALSDDPETLDRVDPRAEKRVRPVRNGFHRRPLPLRCVYVLDYADDDDSAGKDSAEAPPRIAPASPQEAFKALTANAYARAFLKENAGAAHLHRCAQLVNRVPVRRLVRLPALDRLPEVARCVENDTASLGPSAQAASASRERLGHAPSPVRAPLAPAAT